MLDFSQPVNVTRLVMTGLYLFNVEKNSHNISCHYMNFAWCDKIHPRQHSVRQQCMLSADISIFIRKSINKSITQTCLSQLKTDWHMPTYLVYWCVTTGLVSKDNGIVCWLLARFNGFDPTWIALMKKVWASMQWTLTKSTHAERHFGALVAMWFS